MKTTISAAVGGYNFIFDNDAFARLSDYLEKFRKALDPIGAQEVMDELEMRIADLFKERLSGKEVVDIQMVDSIIAQLGLPEGEQYRGSENSTRVEEPKAGFPLGNGGRIMRDPDDRKLGGVCSGLAHYFSIDVTLMRILFLLALVMGTAGFWIYVILWFIVPEANTAAKKCELHGLEVNAENIRRFTSTSNK